MYTNQREQKKPIDPYLPNLEPPSSPPTTNLLMTKENKQMQATTTKTITVNPRDAAGTKYTPVSFAVLPYSHMEAMTHGRPSPRNTLTEFEPVTFPTAESAYFSAWAAAIDAKVSGRDVPRATKVIAVTAGSIPRTHPKRLANSPTTAVTIPMKPRAIQKQAHPPAQCGGGIKAKNSFHPMVTKWRKPSRGVMFSISPSSFLVG